AVEDRVDRGEVLDEWAEQLRVLRRRELVVLQTNVCELGFIQVFMSPDAGQVRGPPDTAGEVDELLRRVVGVRRGQGGRFDGLRVDGQGPCDESNHRFVQFDEGG